MKTKLINPRLVAEEIVQTGKLKKKKAWPSAGDLKKHKNGGVIKIEILTRKTPKLPWQKDQQ